MSVTPEDPPDRSRLISWHRPKMALGNGDVMSGLDLLNALVTRDLPNLPFGELLQIRAVHVRPGEAVFTWTPDDSMYNAIGTVHGGMVCTLLDTAASAAVWSVLPPGEFVVSVEIKVSYVRTIRPEDGAVSATGTVVRTGARVGFAEAVATNAHGNVVATASSTLLIGERPQRASR